MLASLVYMQQSYRARGCLLLERARVRAHDDWASLLRPALVAKKVGRIGAHGQAEHVGPLDKLHLVGEVEGHHEFLDGEHAKDGADPPQRHGQQVGVRCALEAFLVDEQVRDRVLDHRAVEVGGRAGAAVGAVDAERIVVRAAALEQPAELEVRVHLGGCEQHGLCVQPLDHQRRRARLAVRARECHPELLRGRRLRPRVTLRRKGGSPLLSRRLLLLLLRRSGGRGRARCVYESEERGACRRDVERPVARHEAHRRGERRDGVGGGLAGQGHVQDGLAHHEVRPWLEWAQAHGERGDAVRERAVLQPALHECEELCAPLQRERLPGGAVSGRGGSSSRYEATSSGLRRVRTRRRLGIASAAARLARSGARERRDKTGVGVEVECLEEQVARGVAVCSQAHL
mmetsp:Transcript_40825/g.94580  ORF Transcript_40825/g.94580 Transcript_40825/m.94580 type:complete len:402 (+) Transcript_40825:182-1387(+)